MFVVLSASTAKMKERFLVDISPFLAIIAELSYFVLWLKVKVSSPLGTVPNVTGATTSARTKKVILRMS